MHSRITKIAISLPSETFKLVERARHKKHLARSSVVREALELWLRQKSEQELEEQYVNGYKQKPENVADVEKLFQTGLSSFTPEDW